MACGESTRVGYTKSWWQKGWVQGWLSAFVSLLDCSWLHSLYYCPRHFRSKQEWNLWDSMGRSIRAQEANDGAGSWVAFTAQMYDDIFNNVPIIFLDHDQQIPLLHGSNWSPPSSCSPGGINCSREERATPKVKLLPKVQSCLAQLKWSLMQSHWQISKTMRFTACCREEAIDNKHTHNVRTWPSS